MSALFGFCGEADEKRFSEMESSLNHRGESIEKQQGPRANVGYWKSPWAHGHQSGLRVTELGLVAFSGFQTAGPNNTTVTLNEIAIHLSKDQRPPASLTGDFVIAFFSNDGRFFLVRDGSGAGTVYFAEWNNRFYFASEPKGIWSISDFPRQLEPNSLAKYLTYSFVPGEATMLRGIRELKPGNSLVWYPNQGWTTNRFFRFEDVQKCSRLRLGHEESVSEFRKVFSQSVSDRLSLIGNNHPTVFLSGGLDSSIVAAELVRQSTKKVKTYSIHFGQRYPNELEFARMVAQKLGTEHHEILIQPADFARQLPSMVWHLDDPIGDPVTMPNFELARRVGGTTDFVFNGEGGDPCFGGPKNIPMMLLHWYGKQNGPLFREKAYLASYRRAYEELEHIFTPEFRRSLDLDCLTELLSPFFQCQVPSNYLDKLTPINIRLKGAHLILPKIERMLAASGITPLSPLFSSELVQFSFQIPSTMKLNKGREKFVIKQAFKNGIPQAVINRPKSGMRVPVHFWFQGELKKYAKKILGTRQIKAAGIFNHRRIKQLLRYNIEEGNGRYGMRLWMLLTFEIWRRTVIEKRGIQI